MVTPPFGVSFVMRNSAGPQAAGDADAVGVETGGAEAVGVATGLGDADGSAAAHAVGTQPTTTPTQKPAAATVRLNRPIVPPPAEINVLED